MFRRSLETSLIVERLAKCEPGDVVSYEELSTLLGTRVSGVTSQLQSAKRVVLAEHSLYFDIQRGAGLICAGNDGRIASAKDGIKHIHRAANRKLKILGTANVAAMTNEEKMQFNTVASHVGVLAGITTARAQNKLAAAVAVSEQCLPLVKTLEAFK